MLRGASSLRDSPSLSRKARDVLETSAGDASPRTRITHTITYPPARSMLPRNRLELIDRPSPPDEATTLKLLEARAPASSFACTIAASRFIFSLGSVIVSSPDVRFLQTVHEPLIPKRFFLSPARTTCNSSRQKSPWTHHRPQTIDRSPRAYLSFHPRK